MFQLRPHQHQLQQNYRTSGILSQKLPLKLYWTRFSGFCTALQCWFSFLSHYYNLLQFSLPYFATLPSVTFNLSDFSCLQEILCSFLYLIHLVVYGSSLQFAEIIWIAVLPSAVFAILLHDIKRSILSPKSLMKTLSWICSGYPPSTSNLVSA